MTELTNKFLEGAVKGFSAKIMPLTSFAFRVYKDNAFQGDTIQVPYLTASTSQVFGANGYSTPTVMTNQGASVTLGVPLYQLIELSDAA